MTLGAIGARSLVGEERVQEEFSCPVGKAAEDVAPIQWMRTFYSAANRLMVSLQVLCRLNRTIRSTGAFKKVLFSSYLEESQPLKGNLSVARQAGVVA
jgi:hypothetical protein